MNFDQKAFYLVIVVLAICIMECIGQSCLKAMFENPTRIHMFIAGVVSYGIVCYLLVLSYRYKSMGLINVLWSGMSVLAMLTAGALFFHERITPIDIMGVILTLAGIALILMEE